MTRSLKQARRQYYKEYQRFRRKIRQEMGHNEYLVAFDRIPWIDEEYKKQQPSQPWVFPALLRLAGADLGIIPDKEARARIYNLFEQISAVHDAAEYRKRADEAQRVAQRQARRDAKAAAAQRRAMTWCDVCGALDSEHCRCNIRPGVYLDRIYRQSKEEE